MANAVIEANQGVQLAEEEKKAEEADSEEEVQE